MMVILVDEKITLETEVVMDPKEKCAEAACRHHLCYTEETDHV
jgi:hypothetical protein